MFLIIGNLETQHHCNIYRPERSEGGFIVLSAAKEDCITAIKQHNKLSQQKPALQQLPVSFHLNDIQAWGKP